MAAVLQRLPEIFAPSPVGGARLTKRERTRQQLIASAIAVFSARGVAEATMHEVGTAAGVTTGTVYNHFRTKVDLVNAVAVTIAETIRQRSAPSRALLKTGAEQMAAGCRRYLGLAEASPQWALLVLDVASVDPIFRKTIAGFVRTELRRGLRSGEFSVDSEDAALDLVVGAAMEGMRRIASGRARKGHSAVVIAMILRGLGLSPSRASQVAKRPLPLFNGSLAL
jgi:AcrR family transcriptional regulator